MTLNPFCERARAVANPTIPAPITIADLPMIIFQYCYTETGNASDILFSSIVMLPVLYFLLKYFNASNVPAFPSTDK